MLNLISADIRSHIYSTNLANSVWEIICQPEKSAYKIHHRKSYLHKVRMCEHQSVQITTRVSTTGGELCRPLFSYKPFQ